MEQEENVIEIENLTKEYKMFNRKSDRLIETIFPMVNRHRTFKAVDNISLDVKQGEILGILGENGAGKSTLLKMITGVVTPTSGDIRVKGKISSLLELGAAFNTELTGYENIYEHGQVMGLSKQEIEETKQDIIDFADIGEHLYQPVKTYSSGMFARLAFACAINVKPEVLIVDEILSVGDMAFQEKSITRMKKIRENGTTILFVSHSLQAIKNFCTRAIWLRDGKIVLNGETNFVTEEYKKNMIDEPREKEIEIKKEISETKKKETNKNKSIKIKSVKCDKEKYNLFDDIEITVEVENLKDVDNYGVGAIISNSKGENVTAINSIRIEKKINKNSTQVKFLLHKNCFTEDKYYVTISICDENIMFSYDKLEYATFFYVKVPKNSFGATYADGTCACEYEISEK